MHKPDRLDHDLGRCLRRLRQARNIPLATFAQRVGVSCADVRSYKDGTPRIPVRALRRAAEILKVNVTDLFQVEVVPDAELPPTVH